MLQKFLDKTFSYLGYYRNQTHQDLLGKCNDQQMEIHALVNSLGYLQRENQEHNLLLTALISAHGNEEEVLTKPFLSDILGQGLETTFGQDDNGDVHLIVQLKPEICENCGGVCDDCVSDGDGLEEEIK